MVYKRRLGNYLFSPMEQLLRGMDVKKALPVEEWLSRLTKGATLKTEGMRFPITAEEYDLSGLPDFFARAQGPVTRQDILNYLGSEEAPQWDVETQASEKMLPVYRDIQRTGVLNRLPRPRSATSGPIDRPLSFDYDLWSGADPDTVSTPELALRNEVRTFLEEINDPDHLISVMPSLNDALNLVGDLKLNKSDLTSNMPGAPLEQHYLYRPEQSIEYEESLTKYRHATPPDVAEYIRLSNKYGVHQVNTLLQQGISMDQLPRYMELFPERERLEASKPRRITSPHFDDAGEDLVSFSKGDRRVLPDGTRVRNVDEIQNDLLIQYNKAGGHHYGDVKKWPEGYDYEGVEQEVRPASHEEQHWLKEANDAHWNMPKSTDEQVAAANKKFTEATDKLSGFGITYNLDSETPANDLDFFDSSGMMVKDRRNFEFWDNERHIQPKGPFKRNYGLVELKKQLSNAIEDGDDYLIWTGGTAQAERWRSMDLNDVRSLEYYITYANEGNGEPLWNFIGHTMTPEALEGMSHRDTQGLINRGKPATWKDIELDFDEKSAAIIFKRFEDNTRVEEQDGSISEGGHPEGEDYTSTILPEDGHSSFTYGYKGKRVTYDQQFKKNAEKIVGQYGGNKKKDVFQLDPQMGMEQFSPEGLKAKAQADYDAKIAAEKLAEEQRRELERTRAAEAEQQRGLDVLREADRVTNSGVPSSLVEMNDMSDEDLRLNGAFMRGMTDQVSQAISERLPDHIAFDARQVLYYLEALIAYPTYMDNVGRFGGGDLVEIFPEYTGRDSFFVRTDLQNRLVDLFKDVELTRSAPDLGSLGRAFETAISSQRTTYGMLRAFMREFNIETGDHASHIFADAPEWRVLEPEERRNLLTSLLTAEGIDVPLSVQVRQERLQAAGNFDSIIERATELMTTPQGTFEWAEGIAADTSLPNAVRTVARNITNEYANAYYHQHQENRSVVRHSLENIIHTLQNSRTLQGPQGWMTPGWSTQDQDALIQLESMDDNQAYLDDFDYQHLLGHYDQQVRRLSEDLIDQVGNLEVDTDGLTDEEAENIVNTAMDEIPNLISSLRQRMDTLRNQALDPQNQDTGGLDLYERQIPQLDIAPGTIAHRTLLEAERRAVDRMVDLYERPGPIDPEELTDAEILNFARRMRADTNMPEESRIAAQDIENLWDDLGLEDWGPEHDQITLHNLRRISRGLGSEMERPAPWLTGNATTASTAEVVSSILDEFDATDPTDMLRAAHDVLSLPNMSNEAVASAQSIIDDITGANNYDVWHAGVVFEVVDNFEIIRDELNNAILGNEITRYQQGLAQPQLVPDVPPDPNIPAVREEQQANDVIERVEAMQAGQNDATIFDEMGGLLEQQDVMRYLNDHTDDGVTLAWDNLNGWVESLDDPGFPEAQDRIPGALGQLREALLRYRDSLAPAPVQANDAIERADFDRNLADLIDEFFEREGGAFGAGAFVDDINRVINTLLFPANLGIANSHLLEHPFPSVRGAIERLFTLDTNRGEVIADLADDSLSLDERQGMLLRQDEIQEEILEVLNTLRNELNVGATVTPPAAEQMPYQAIEATPQTQIPAAAQEDYTRLADVINTQLNWPDETGAPGLRLTRLLNHLLSNNTLTGQLLRDHPAQEINQRFMVIEALDGQRDNAIDVPNQARVNELEEQLRNELSILSQMLRTPALGDVTGLAGQPAPGRTPQPTAAQPDLKIPVPNKTHWAIKITPEMKKRYYALKKKYGAGFSRYVLPPIGVGAAEIYNQMQEDDGR